MRPLFGDQPGRPSSVLVLYLHIVFDKFFRKLLNSEEGQLDQNLQAAYNGPMSRSKARLLKEYAREFARKGGLARAKKYDTAKLSEWGKLGGRPRKKRTRVKGVL